MLCVFGAALLSGCGGGADKKEAAEGNEQEGMAMHEEERASPLKVAEGQIGGKNVSVQYGAPSVKGRKIWGDLEAYGEVWRTGANEATHVNFSEDVTVEGEPLAAGKYSLFTIPQEEGAWTVIFNSEWNLEHGHYQYKEENDVLRVQVMPEWVEENQEQLEITLEDPGVVVRWEKLRLPIEIK
ncbi:DUF2911 domain-containing protein [Echinicola sediminis]